MFPSRHFADTFFAPRYFPPVGADPAIPVQTISTTGDARNFFRISGRLCKDPTDLSLAFPHGGTDLGAIRSGVFAFNEISQEIISEELGATPVDYLWQGHRASLSLVLREWDNDALTELFPNLATGASGKALIRGLRYGSTSDTPPGSLLSDRSSAILVSPRDPIHPAVLLYEAMPMLSETSGLQMSIGQDFGVAVVFHPLHNASGKQFAVGLLEDLTL